MKRIKRLDPIINKAVRASFSEGNLLTHQVTKLLNTFKKMPKTEAIYLVSGYLKGLKREMAKHTLVVESAIDLSPSELSQIKKTLNISQLINAERLMINENLLGGIRVKIADTVYDFSVKQRIQQLKGAIRG